MVWWFSGLLIGPSSSTRMGGLKAILGLEPKNILVWHLDEKLNVTVHEELGRGRPKKRQRTRKLD